MSDNRKEAFKRVVGLAKAAPKRRDQIMILCGGVLGLSVNALRGLTLEQAHERFETARQEHPEAALYLDRVLDLVESHAEKEGIEPHRYLFPSTRHHGRLDRTVVWRIINGAGKVAFPDRKWGIRQLQAHSRAILTGDPV